jgi:hypothetical protein
MKKLATILWPSEFAPSWADIDTNGAIDVRAHNGTVTLTGPIHDKNCRLSYGQLDLSAV